MLLIFKAQEDIQDAVSALNLPKKNLIFIPINNNTDIDNIGGAHW